MRAEIPQGEYQGTIKQWGLGESKEKQTPCFYAVFEIQLNGTTYKRTVYWWLTTGTRDYVVRDLRRLGYQHASLDPLDPAHPDAFDFFGVTESLYCKHESYKGEPIERWSLAHSSGGGGVDDLNSRRLRELNTLFGKALKETSSGQPAPQPEPITVSDDDPIPF